jgi:rod shape-determining protein MreC
MALDTLASRRPAPRSPASPDARRGTRDRRDQGGARDGRRPSRSLLLALVLACLTLMVVDRAGGESSPVEPVRRVAGEVLGPAQAFATEATRPLVALPDAFRSTGSLRDQVAELEAENAELESALRAHGYDERRITELRNLRAVAGDLGYALLPARVVAIGPAQSFSHTVTIDAGSDAGLRPDQTVLASAGLVGRITAVTSHTATVRLVVDSDLTVGGRVGETMELGFVHGRGGVGGDARLDLELVDETVVPRSGQRVVTWGSEGGAPYVAGVPIGEVTQVYESLRDTSYRAVLRPFVDFSSLDLVGVVVPTGTETTRPVIEADRSVRMP